MRLILQILLILVIALTLGVCIKKPDMHKTLFVYDSAYIPVETKTSDEGSKKTEVVKSEEVIVYEQPVQKPVQKTTTVTKPVQQTSVKKQTTTSAPQAKTTTKTTQPQQTARVQKTETKPAQTETKITPPIPKPVEVVKTDPVVKPVTTQTTPQSVKVLTQQEEEIAWNTWRSNLQNKIMQDVRLPSIPNGVIFRFSFTVDKFGKISNLQTWTEPSTYTPHAIQYVAPVIRSYQGRSILNFPEGSSRTTTTVKGGWKISSVERYSTPKDYNDIERVQK